ncbi:MAG TPA: von Willebrand factor type A domain-containing protein [Ferruginibacter sp.]|nr:von Willebrand factor type A domain-containing protein [Ferruginibacter sp.]HMP21711.1 von Willebrand factor type A domain-containing protein [Ferruginibacter sp.]
MKRVACILLLVLGTGEVKAQYFFRGTVTDNRGDKLQYVKITSQSSGNIYRSNVQGGFGFNGAVPFDTIYFSYDGYETVTRVLKANEHNTIVLNALPVSAIFKKNHLSSIAAVKKDSARVRHFYNETYNKSRENIFLFTDEAPVISFSANINRASYSNVRRFINDMDGPVPADAVRIEEMLNYFNFHYREPEKDSMFSFSSVITQCPWNPASQLLLLNVCAQKINTEHLPASNLVFLIDVSGSMDMPNKLPLLKAGFRMLVKNLRAIDTVSIVTYGETVEVPLEAIAGSEKEKITAAIDALTADGPTPGEAGIKLAYHVAQKHFIKGGNNRIFLGADGDFNVGMNTEKELENLIEYQKQSGVYLTCLGVGMGNYKDSKLAVLSQMGNGNFAYLDNEQEAEKVLVSELTQTLFTVADNVYISVAFNPSTVVAYRLTGYDNDHKAHADTNMRIEGGEIGSGHSLMAVFELLPLTDSNTTGNILADIKVQYSLPGLRNIYSTGIVCPNNYTPWIKTAPDIKKAVAVVLFGMKLRQSVYSQKVSWKKLNTLCRTAFDPNNYIEKELLELVEKAQKLYRKKRKYSLR